jgi:hypothetical protein
MQKSIFACNPVIGTEELLDRASRFYKQLCQNSPKPFHRSTVIQYSLATQCDVTLSIYNVTGSLVEKAVYGRQGPGVYRVPWSGDNVTDGIYFYRLQACPERSGELDEGQSRRAYEYSESRKMVLVR